MDGMLSAELVGPVEVDCNPERILLGLTVGLNETVLFCDLTLGMAPALAFHTKLSFSFDRLDVKATLQLPRDKKVIELWTSESGSGHLQIGELNDVSRLSLIGFPTNDEWLYSQPSK